MNPCNNPLINPTEEQNKLAGPQGLAKKSDADSNKALISPEAPIPPFIPLTKDFFTKFMKVFVKLTQAQD